MGHAIVGGIAARELTPAARARVEAMLGRPAAAHMAEVSSWADWQGRERPDTKPWHYVDIEIGSARYVPARDCPAGACIVGAIAREEQILRDHSASRDARAEALVWLIHLVGDLHQPLHCADAHDRGGNGYAMRIGGRRTNLHAVWDRAPEYLRESDAGEDAAAATLDHAITQRQRAAWRQGGVADWANESFVIARDRIYVPLGLSNAPADPPPETVRAQLEKAGVRLAVLLNRDLL